MQCFEKFSVHQINTEKSIPLEECKNQIASAELANKEKNTLKLEAQKEDLKYECNTQIAVAKGETIELLKKNFDF